MKKITGTSCRCALMSLYHLNLRMSHPTKCYEVKIKCKLKNPNVIYYSFSDSCVNKLHYLERFFFFTVNWIKTSSRETELTGPSNSSSIFSSEKELTETLDYDEIILLFKAAVGNFVNELNKLMLAVA